jgi:hypothetical protein
MFTGFADATPSEAIQKHHLPRATVGIIFPILNNPNPLKIPVKQYKDVNPRQKAHAADELSEWLTKQKAQGLHLAGFAHAHSQREIARLGLELVAELPDTYVEPHFNSYRLFFGGECIDFPQAVALGYYFFTIMFGVIPLSTLPREYRSLFIAMDRFPGAKINTCSPGIPLPPTQGLKFIWYLQNHSITGRGIIEKQKSIGLLCTLGTLDWWKMPNNIAWICSKDHPHFILADWLVASVSATTCPNETIGNFHKNRTGTSTVDALNRLHRTFKTFNIWGFDDESVKFIKGEEGQWNIPQDACDFIYARTEQSNTKNMAPSSSTKLKPRASTARE